MRYRLFVLDAGRRLAAKPVGRQVAFGAAKSAAAPFVHFAFLRLSVYRLTHDVTAEVNKRIARITMTNGAKKSRKSAIATFLMW